MDAIFAWEDAPARTFLQDALGYLPSLKDENIGFNWTFRCSIPAFIYLSASVSQTTFPSIAYFKISTTVAAQWTSVEKWQTAEEVVMLAWLRSGFHWFTPGWKRTSRVGRHSCTQRIFCQVSVQSVINILPDDLTTSNSFYQLLAKGHLRVDPSETSDSEDSNKDNTSNFWAIYDTYCTIHLSMVRDRSQYS